MITSYLRFFREEAGSKAGGAVLLMVILGLLEGTGLLVLLPMLDLIGISPSQGTSRLGNTIRELFRNVGLPPTLGVVLGLFVFLTAVQAWLRHFLDIQNTRIETTLTVRLRERLYAAMVRADWLFFTRHRASDMTQVLTDELHRVGSGTQQLLAMLATAGVALVQAIIAFLLSPILTALALASGASLALVLRRFTRRTQDVGKAGQEMRAEMMAAITEHLGGMKVAKSHGRESHHAGHFVRIINEIADYNVAMTRIHTTSRACYEIGAVVALSLFLYCGVRFAQLDAPELLLLVFIFSRLLPRISTLQGAWQRFIGMLPSFAAAESLREGFTRSQEPVWPDSREHLNLQKEIRFEGVTFHYGDGREQTALHGVDLVIPAGRITAICGPSGAGKSTLADLLMGLLQPTSGGVLVDGKPLTDRRIHDWRQSVGYVPQETFLFHETVRSNLLWARPEAVEAEVRAALRAAAAEDFVNRLPQGLDTVVGDRGVRLSGGERQRLALARALLRQPSILVLDEATSALDPENERLIKEAIQRLHGELTIVVIAHRLSTVRQADSIVVLDAGRVAQQGRWEDLATQTDSLFARMLQSGSVDTR